MKLMSWSLALFLCLGWSLQALADEGMWLYTNAPLKHLKEKYGFEPTPEWLDHLRQSSVRFNSGGSGSFVSSDGLVLTNHHVGADAIAKLSSADHNYLDDGFHARTPDKELKCVDLELNVLVSIEDVTDKVNGSVPKGADAAAAQKARRAMINSIEQESTEKTQLRSDVVTLYQGGRYHLYCYKKYTDVRLVFAPEKEIAFFGGDPDNFEFPRYDLDFAIFRVYENDKPVKIEHFLAWSDVGVKEGDLTFVSGHPGRTSRLNSVAHLKYLRDIQFPETMDLLRRREVNLKTFGDRSLENMRRAQDELFGIQNSRKARLGGLAGLQDPALFAKKEAAEALVRNELAKAGPDSGNPFEAIEKSLTALKEFRTEYSMLERGLAFDSAYFGVARTILRMADESKKPNAERLREFSEAGLDSLKQELFSEAPIYEDLETIKLADSLSMYLEKLGPGHPLAKAILAGKSPRNRAAELVAGTKLKDVETRKKLAAMSPEELRKSTDTFIQLAVAVDEAARKLRTRYETEVDEPQRTAYAKIAEALFEMKGTDAYPDATFTLRLAYGPVKGYTDLGKKIDPITKMGDTFKHADAHGNVEPFKLPKRWLDKKNEINPETPFNFVTTADIIGGNSGSPVVNTKGELVGLIFDGNIQSLVLDFAFEDTQARATSVDARAIKEALIKVYDAKELADKLGR
jgi:hypothetical protein